MCCSPKSGFCNSHGPGVCCAVIPPPFLPQWRCRWLLGLYWLQHAVTEWKIIWLLNCSSKVFFINEYISKFEWRNLLMFPRLVVYQGYNSDFLLGLTLRSNLVDVKYPVSPDSISLPFWRDLQLYRSSPMPHLVLFDPWKKTNKTGNDQFQGLRNQGSYAKKVQYCCCCF